MASKLHVRSNSLPNGSHPWSSRVQEQLNNLRNFEATCTSESVVKGLSIKYVILNQHQDLSILSEVIEMNKCVFQCLLSFLGGPSKSKASKWMNKLMQKGEVNSESGNEWQLVDAALNTLLNEGAKGSQIQASNEQLEALEIAIESIESGLENLFRRMIKTRTSLLNILSQ
ncbi:uncharacterized protein LOC107639979 [Arachis ipaensis]|uniref:uncharacterized protein LOC107639979 n=1 Tax=Arachis ipaensis TaxID=130454 RepID=UPI000A2B6B91|nr:uncharacterized protein LOC107639979 [Arachis ipaensis]